MIDERSAAFYAAVVGPTVDFNPLASTAARHTFSEICTPA